jgi:TRAP-type C4-dicarboxylate transport system substrate-binding protein
MNKPHKIRWLIAHEPVNLFLRTAEAFKEKLSELTNNQFEVEIFTPTHYLEQAEFQAKFGPIPSMQFAKDNGPMMELEAGNIEMSQLHITELAQWHNPDFYALELPFLFQDHDHATRVFEGPIGKELLSGLADKSPARGLAFTYSGGFRCVASKNGITSLEDLKGVTFATAINPVTIDTIRAVGAIADPFPIKDHARKFKEEGWSSDVVETTIPRYLAQFSGTSKKHLTNTKHSLFLTSIIVGNKFWASLDEKSKEAFQEASLYASRLERKWSVEDAENFAAKEDHSDIGVTFNELSESETAKFKDLVAPIYDKYKDFFTPSLVDGIIRS